MKHKTLFRMMLKLLGLWVFVGGINSLVGQFAYLVYLSTTNIGGPSGQAWYSMMNFAGVIVHLGIGAYLFFGGKWIVDLAIPGNRPYCHECGYDLTNAPGHVCTECGTPFKLEVNPAR